jgi:hypothetical protein
MKLPKEPITNIQISLFKDIQRGLNIITDVCNTLDCFMIEEETAPPKFSDQDLANAVRVFFNILGNRIIYNLQEQEVPLDKAYVIMEEAGENFHKFILETTGFNTKTFKN